MAEFLNILNKKNKFQFLFVNHSNATRQLLTLFSGQYCYLQVHFNKLNVLAICSATKVSMARTLSAWNILRIWEFLKNDRLPQNDVFQEYVKFSIFSQNNDLLQTQSCIFHFLSGKRHTDMARKRGQPFKRLKLPR